MRDGKILLEQGLTQPSTLCSSGAAQKTLHRGGS